MVERNVPGHVGETAGLHPRTPRSAASDSRGLRFGLGLGLRGQAVEGAFHVMPVGRFGRTLLPKSPCRPYLVGVYSPPLNTGTGLPPAIPQGSDSGASPGDRHGWVRVRFSVRVRVRARPGDRHGWYFSRFFGASTSMGSWVGIS